MRGNTGIRRRGLTLVEMMIALLFSTGVCAGLYQVGLQARRYAEHSRVATEARSMAKEKLEEITSYGLEDLKTSPYWWNVETNAGSTGAIIVRQPQVTWHLADGSESSMASATYAEIHVQVVFHSPLLGKPVTNSFPMIVY